MKLEIRHSCPPFQTYRAARVRSLFNCEDGHHFALDAELPLEGREWKIGLVVGPSGSGKTSIGKRIFGDAAMVRLDEGWPVDLPIIEAVAPDRDFDAATNALAAVGLGSVPAWLRPFQVLSNGERFRAGLARLLADPPAVAVVDEWTSVIDRQIARIGSLAFAKAWRRTSSQAVLLSCHYDVAEWLQPDWIFDTATGKFDGRCLRRRPPFTLEISETDWRFWPLFEPHHYLKLPHMIAATCYVGNVDGKLVSHLGVGPAFHIGGMRACRMVVMPEWQGAGVGMRFLNAVCQLQLEGRNRWRRKVPTYFHTSHPALCSGLRRDPKWRQCSAILFGGDKVRSAASIDASRRKSGKEVCGTGYGGHFRAVQGFKYLGA